MALTKLKIAVFAPIPSASVSTATAVKPGFFNSWRKPNFKSFMVCCQLSVAGCSLLVVRWSAAQIPNTKLQRNPKLQTPNGASLPPYWSLEFGASLGFGFWDLELSFVPQRLPVFDVKRSMFDVRFIHNAAPLSDRLWL